MDRELLLKAYCLWSSFKEEVLYRNRFIIEHEVLDYLKQIANTYRKTIEKDTILYRARIYTADDSFLQYLNNKSDTNNEESLLNAYYKAGVKFKQTTGFWGYGEKDSYVPSNNELISDGRVNPSFIKYLYTAEEPYTALVEVRPYLGSKVSVAEVRVNEPLVVADLSYESFGKLEEFEQNLMYLIMSDFSKPSDSDKKSYIPTQYVSEFIKTLGIEGIKFNSSLYSRGRNITIFNFDKCQPIASKLYEIKDICIEAKGIAPINEKSLIHYKLEPYQSKQIDQLLKGFETLKNKKEN